VAPPANAVAVTPSAASPPAGQALVRVRVRPFGYVYVDGALIGPSPPVREVPLAPGRHRIEARNADARPPTVATDVSLDGGAARDVELRFGR
jgi:non-specific serine/threonine protein kinase